VRIFVSSPGDVNEERRHATAVIDKIQKDPAFRDRLKLDPILWDDPEAPAAMLANLTPQESVNRGLVRPSECDIVVTIFWGRMGTPLEKPLKKDKTPYLSGTEWEFQDAVRARRSILLYRCTAKVPTDLDDPELENKRTQKRLVDQFFERLKGPAGASGAAHATYDTPGKFTELLEHNLRHLLEELLATGPLTERQPASSSAHGRTRREAKRPPPAVPAAYRDWLKKDTGRLEVLGIGGAQGRSLFLGSVYVPLLTTGRDPGASGPTRTDEARPEREQALLLHALGRRSLYVSGGPGSGKSTFCNWVAWLACEGAMPVPDLESPSDFVETFPPSLAGRLPLLVRLRESWRWFVARATDGASPAESLVAALQATLEEKSAPAGDLDLGAFFRHGLALLIVDGVDEVPTAFSDSRGDFNPRALVLSALASAVRKWTPKGNVVLVTSRPYGLTDDDVRRLQLHSAPVADLPGELQQLLVRRWFRIQKQDQLKGDGVAAALMGDIGEREWLQPLAANPLMLTAMCAIYSDGGKLPQDRHQLYDRIVDSVLTTRYAETKRRNRVRFELGAIAHAMHTGEVLGVQHVQPLAQATFDEAELALRNDESAGTQRDSVLRPKDAREDLLAHSGLLTGRGEKQLGFYHLSIQEFLAAERIFELRLDDLRGVFLERAANPNWRNTLSFLFARFMSAFSVAARPLALLRDLVSEVSPDTFGLQLVVADCAEILDPK
jgi:hypothetical protein